MVWILDSTNQQEFASDMELMEIWEKATMSSWCS